VKVADLQPGDSTSRVVVDDLSRTQIVMYAGASGDFNPLHTDEVYATGVGGYGSVFAHGQLTMALTAKAVTAWLDEAELVTLGARFRDQVWPGATLTTTVTVDSVEDGTATVSLETVDQSGRVVITGYATLRDAS
jgi:acyl dehydratase